MKFPIAQIRPNPFRDLEFNGYDEETIDGLMASIQETGFWPNITARLHPDGVEIAYGHHRVEAARRLRGEAFEIDLAIGDLDDRTMLKMMIAENINQRGNAAANEFETARSIVYAVADGRISLDLDPETSKQFLRYAPSFVPPEPGDVTSGKSYTVMAVAEFFGWDVRKARYVFGALELDELGILPIQDLMGMSTTAVRQLVDATRTRLETAAQAARMEEERIARLEDEAANAPEEASSQIVQEIDEARAASTAYIKQADRDIKETAKTVRDKLENREITTRAIKDVAREIERKNADANYRPPPPAARFVSTHIRRCDAFFNETRDRELAEIVNTTTDIAAMSNGSVDQLVDLSTALRTMAGRAQALSHGIDQALASAGFNEDK